MTSNEFRVKTIIKRDAHPAATLTMTVIIALFNVYALRPLTYFWNSNP